MISVCDAFKHHPKFMSAQVSSPEPYPFSLLTGGLPKTGLVEISGQLGSGKTESVLIFLKENPSIKLSWIETHFTVYPASFFQYQVELSRILFIDLGSSLSRQSAFWSTAQILKSSLFQAIVLSQIIFTEIELRRIQLLSKQTGTLILFLQKTPIREKSWPLTLQIEASRSNRAPTPDLTILKSRNSERWSSQKQ